MRRVLATEHGAQLYRQRQQLIEPEFANTKFNRGMERFHRRGRSAARTEWRGGRLQPVEHGRSIAAIGRLPDAATSERCGASSANPRAA
jgi:hypothetical protein